MDKAELQNRTKRFALEIIALVEELPKKKISYVISDQILRSCTSVGANYRAACRARSNKDFLSKITIVEEEADETLFWLELIDESKLLTTERLRSLKKEANELTAIFTASGRTTRMRLNNNN